MSRNIFRKCETCFEAGVCTLRLLSNARIQWSAEKHFTLLTDASFICDKAPIIISAVGGSVLF